MVGQLGGEEGWRREVERSALGSTVASMGLIHMVRDMDQCGWASAPREVVFHPPKGGSQGLSPYSIAFADTGQFVFSYSRTIHRYQID